MKDYLKDVTQPHIKNTPPTPVLNQKENTRCTACGFIRYSSFDDFNLKPCPKCKSKYTMVPSHDGPQEAISLLCEAFNITPMSKAGQKVKQAVDVLCSYL